MTRRLRNLSFSLPKFKEALTKLCSAEPLRVTRWKASFLDNTRLWTSIWFEFYALQCGNPNICCSHSASGGLCTEIMCGTTRAFVGRVKWKLRGLMRSWYLLGAGLKLKCVNLFILFNLCGPGTWSFGAGLKLKCVKVNLTQSRNMYFRCGRHIFVALLLSVLMRHFHSF